MRIGKAKVRNTARPAVAGLLEPRSLAVVGASADQAKLGYTLLKNVIEGGFAGGVYPVNPSGGEILGKKVYASVSAIPEPPDLVLVSIPSRRVPGVIKESARRGARFAVILASAFSEMGGEGNDLQAAVMKVCSGHKIRIVGPNCMGVYNSGARLNGTYFWEIPQSAPPMRNVAFISQSGAYGGMFFSEIRRRGFGISKFISIGNQCDVAHFDFFNYLSEDKQTRVVAMFIEQVKKPARFLGECAKLAARKPVVVMKVGRTAAGKRAAVSHTGSIAGDWEVFAQAMRQCGAHVAADSDEFFDAIQMFSAYPAALLAPPAVAIATISGGPCVAAGDACESLGLAVPELEPATQKEIRRYIPEFGAVKNPVDMTPQMDPDKFPAAVDAIFKSRRIGGVVSINVGLDRPQFAEAFTAALNRRKKPVTAFIVDNPEISRRFLAAGIPAFPTPERAARSLAFLVERERLVRSARSFKARPRAAGPGGGGGGHVRVLSEDKARKILKRVPFCPEEFVSDETAARAAAKRLGFPVVVKVFGTGGHKSDKGGVVTGIWNTAGLRSALGRLRRRFPGAAGFIVQKQVESKFELIFGARVDETFGPYVMFGIGGIFTELIGKFVIRLCPVSPACAAQMVRDAPFFGLLSGARGSAPVDVRALAGIIVALSDIMLANSRIREIDINPVMIGGRVGRQIPIAVDSLVTLGENPRASGRRADG